MGHHDTTRYVTMPRHGTARHSERLRSADDQNMNHLDLEKWVDLEPAAFTAASTSASSFLSQHLQPRESWMIDRVSGRLNSS